MTLTPDAQPGDAWGRSRHLLYLAYRLPYPPDKGERIRSYHQIRCLSDHFRVHLVCPVSSEDRTRVDGIRPYCASVHGVQYSSAGRMAREAVVFLRGRPRMVGAFVSRPLRRAVLRVLRDHPVDLLFVSTLHVAEAAPQLATPPKVVDLVDAYSALWRSASEMRRGPSAWLSALEADRLERYEARLVEEFDRAIVISEAEGALLRRRLGEVPLAVVGNGVDPDRFRPPPKGPLATPKSVVFTGTMDYLPNADAVRFFCREIWPRVRDVRPDVRFTIVGRDPPRSVRSLSADPTVHVTGRVSDIRPYLARAWVAVAPFRTARGVQNKILEALAAGVPVVATSAALAGLGPEAEGAVCRADDPGSFAGELLALLDDPQWRRDRSRNGRRYVERFHSWAEHGARLRKTLLELVPA